MDVSITIIPSVPTGAVIDFAGLEASIPNGFLKCEGQAVSRTVYYKLYQKLSTTYGIGDGVSTFNLPDLRGRTSIGVGQGTGLTNRTLADKVGAETHQLTVNEMPSHNHSITDPGHSHGVQTHVNTSGGGTQAILKSDDTYVGIGGLGTNSATTGISIQNRGGDQAHNNMQPSIALFKIIKI